MTTKRRSDPGKVIPHRPTSNTRRKTGKPRPAGTVRASMSALVFTEENPDMPSKAATLTLTPSEVGSREGMYVLQNPSRTPVFMMPCSLTCPQPSCAQVRVRGTRPVQTSQGRHVRVQRQERRDSECLADVREDEETSPLRGAEHQDDELPVVPRRRVRARRRLHARSPVAVTGTRPHM